MKNFKDEVANDTDAQIQIQSLDASGFSIKLLDDRLIISKAGDHLQVASTNPKYMHSPKKAATIGINLSPLPTIHRSRRPIRSRKRASRSVKRCSTTCAWGRREGLKSIRECKATIRLDLDTLVWTRGATFPVSMLEGRLKCPTRFFLMHG
jgi:hypothetical protein